MDGLLLRRRMMMGGIEPPVFNPRTAYLTFEATVDSTTVKFCRNSNQAAVTLKTIEYSIDGGNTWISYTAKGTTSAGTMVTLNAGAKVMVRGDNANYAPSSGATTTRHLRWVFNNPVYVYGNIMSLINSESFSTLEAFTATHAIKGMFVNQPIIAHPTKYLLLPAKTVTGNTYQLLFSGCSQLTRIVCLATNISASNCTTNMTNGVASEGVFIKDANMSSWGTGTSGVPDGWTVTDYVEPI